jgi:hypothetical protein
LRNDLQDSDDEKINCDKRKFTVGRFSELDHEIEREKGDEVVLRSLNLVIAKLGIRHICHYFTVR